MRMIDKEIKFVSVVSNFRFKPHSCLSVGDDGNMMLPLFVVSLCAGLVHQLENFIEFFSDYEMYL